MTAFQPFGDRSMAGQMKLPAALLTSRSAAPNRSVQASKNASTCAGSRTSHGTAIASPPASAIIATVSSIGSGRRPHTATFAPRAARSSANARPIPPPPPVIAATRPSKRVSAHHPSRSIT